MDVLPEVLRQLPEPGTDPEGDAPLEGLRALERVIGYAFADRRLLRTALTLGSWANEHPDAGWPSNSCLEFFGDSVLGLLAADRLWIRFPDLAEGELTRLRAALVSERALSTIATGLDLGQWLYLGRGDLKRGGRGQASTLADTVEAILGAVFLDARAAGGDGLRAAGAVFDTLFGARLASLTPDHGLHPKSSLQHWAQRTHRVTPTYVRVGTGEEESEPWRARVELRRDDAEVLVLGVGEGSSLRRAERAAAEHALARIEDGEFDDPAWDTGVEPVDRSEGA